MGLRVASTPSNLGSGTRPMDEAVSFLLDQRFLAGQLEASRDAKRLIAAIGEQGDTAYCAHGYVSKQHRLPHGLAQGQGTKCTAMCGTGSNPLLSRHLSTRRQLRVRTPGDRRRLQGSNRPIPT